MNIRISVVDCKSLRIFHWSFQSIQSSLINLRMRLAGKENIFNSKESLSKGGEYSRFLV